MFLGELLMVAAWQLAVEQCKFSAKYLVMKVLIISWLNLKAEGGWRRSVCSDKGTLFYSLSVKKKIH